MASSSSLTFIFYISVLTISSTATSTSNDKVEDAATTTTPEHRNIVSNLKKTVTVFEINGSTHNRLENDSSITLDIKNTDKGGVPPTTKTTASDKISEQGKHSTKQSNSGNTKQKQPLDSMSPNKISKVKTEVPDKIAESIIKSTNADVNKTDFNDKSIPSEVNTHHQHTTKKKENTHVKNIKDKKIVKVKNFVREVGDNAITTKNNDIDVSTDNKNKENYKNKPGAFVFHTAKSKTKDVTADDTDGEKDIAFEDNVVTDDVNQDEEDVSFDSNADSTERVLLVALGGGEDELFIANVARLLVANGQSVVALVYGAVREMPFPKSVKIIEIPVTEEDPVQLSEGVSDGEGVGTHEWAAGSIVWSRVVACSGLASVHDQISSLKPALLITPLWLHDVCTLNLAKQLDVPAIGVVTSRVGAWWAWAQLGALPDLSTASAPTGGNVDDQGIYARAANLARHYAFISTMRQRWQAPAMAALPYEWQQASLPSLYRGLHRLLVAWDPLLHPSPPHTPSAVAVGGFSADLTPITKDVLVPAILNRAGVIVVNPGGREVWIGKPAMTVIYRCLASLPYTILWNTAHEHLRPSQTADSADGKTNSIDEEADKFDVRAKFIFKENLPLNGVLGHPRHRLLISSCGELDVNAAAHFASPVLCVPVTTDQWLAAMHLKHLGVAEVVPAWEATEDRITDSLRELFGDRRYRLKARELAEELHDQPVSPSEVLLYHIQHSIRRPKSMRYHIQGSDLSLLQQGNADVYLLLLMLLVLLSSAVMWAALAFGPVIWKKTKRKTD